jgi:hypothetical protein
VVIDRDEPGRKRGGSNGNDSRPQNEIAKLSKMKVNELQAKFAEVTGEKTRSPNRTFLVRKITEALRGASAKVDRTPEGAALNNGDITTQKEPAAVNGKLTRLEVPELQARYLDVVGRHSGSTSKPYLVWKIRQAQKGRIPVGPRKSVRKEGATFRVLPLRMESDLVDKLDEAWRRHGLKNRTDLFRKSLHVFLQSAGENEVAALFADAT